MDRKYLARSFFFLLYQFLNHKYEKVEVVFISHSTEAARVSEDDFFKVSTHGGTLISSCLNLELDTIKKEFHPNSWNIYSFYCGDGENWSADNEKCIDLFKKIKDVLGFQSDYSLKDGVIQIFDGLKNGTIDDNIKTITLKWYQEILANPQLYEKFSINGKLL